VEKNAAIVVLNGIVCVRFWPKPDLNYFTTRLGKGMFRMSWKVVISAGLAGLVLAWMADHFSVHVGKLHIAIVIALAVTAACIWEVRRFRKLEELARADGRQWQGTSLRAAALREVLRHSFKAIGLGTSAIPFVFDETTYVKAAEMTDGTHVVVGKKSIAVHRYSADPRERDLRTYKTTDDFLRAFIGERIVWVCTVDPASSTVQAGALRSGNHDEFLAERKRFESSLWKRFDSVRRELRWKLLCGFLP